MTYHFKLYKYVILYHSNRKWHQMKCFVTLHMTYIYCVLSLDGEAWIQMLWRHYISSTIGFKSYFDIGKTSVFLIKKVFKLTNYKSTHLRYSKNVTTAETTWRTKISCNRKHKLMTHRNLDCTLRIWNYIQRKLFESKKSIIISLFTFIWYNLLSTWNFFVLQT